MERTEILSKIQELLAEIIDNEELVIDETSSPSTVEDWDSLTHFNLIMELQKEFGIKFGAAEIQGWQNVGDIISSISAKQL
ncbi:MAG: acyl carrier protein [Candidatus Cryptobacteroides sp.]|nr:acyl carrier protein [Candidatus Cryptobacteroides sp.]